MKVFPKKHVLHQQKNFPCIKILKKCLEGNILIVIFLHFVLVHLK